MIPGTDTIDQKQSVIQTSCEEPFLDDCNFKSFNFTYYHHGNSRDVEDSTMTLTCFGMIINVF